MTAEPGTRSDSFTVLVPRDEDRPLGLAVLHDVRGKDQLITILVAADTGLAVVALEILTYREPYGGEVGNESWRTQFRGARPGDRLRPGREIRNITGATISVRSVTEGVNTILRLLPRFASSLSLRS
jgi:Na+-translocating ferredoxin:NAD+ oxidoreductase RnfG subunit